MARSQAWASILHHSRERRSFSWWISCKVCPVAKETNADWIDLNLLPVVWCSCLDFDYGDFKNKYEEVKSAKVFNKDAQLAALQSLKALQKQLKLYAKLVCSIELTVHVVVVSMLL